MKLIGLVLLLCFLLAFAGANKTVTLDRNRLHNNPLRTQLIEAARHQHSSEIENCLLAIPFDDPTLIPGANRCTCEYGHTLRALQAIPMRAKGLDAACRHMTPPPSVNIFDATMDLRMLCATSGVHQSWPFCSLF